MRYLVDGYNVIRGTPRFRDIERREGLEAGREALVRALLSSPLLARASVTLVFDGAASGPETGTSPHPRLRVRFSRPPENADAAIVSLLGKHSGDESASVVVSADRDLQWEARKRGVSVELPEAWLSKVTPRPGRKVRKTGSDSSGKPAASREEVAWGLSVFGDGEEVVLPRHAPSRGKRRRHEPTPQSVDGDGQQTAAAIKERRRERHRRRTRRRHS